MDDKEIKKVLEDSKTRYQKFIRWIDRHVKGDAMIPLMTSTAHIQMDIVNSLKDKTGNKLLLADKNADEWMDYIKKKHSSCQNPIEFEEWVLSHKEVLIENSTNFSRKRTLDNWLSGPDIKLQ